MNRPVLPPEPRHKRGWLYGGLAVAPGVAMARRPTYDERNPRVIVPTARDARLGAQQGRGNVALVGGPGASAVEPTLRRVLGDYGRALVRTQLAGLPAQARAYQGGFVVIVDALPPEVLLAAADEVRRHGARLVVAPPPRAPWLASRPVMADLRAARVSVVPTGRIQMPVAPGSGGPSAAGYAALAGAIWTYLR